MAELKANAFAGYVFSEEELARAASFNMEQKMYLQTVMSDAAMEKINLEPNTSNMLAFIQKEAYLRGQIDIMEYLLSTEPSQAIGRAPSAEEKAVRAVGIDWMAWQQTAAPTKP